MHQRRGRTINRDTSMTRESGGPMHVALQSVEWSGIFAEAVEDLRTLIRFDTTNPPGNEIIAARWLKERFNALAVLASLLESAPGRGNVVARIRGDGSGQPLLLNAHLDVVPADADSWAHPPFAARIVDGILYGRGAIDMKNMAAMSLAAFRLISRQNIALRRDLIFVGCADEEAGSNLGSRWLAAHHPDLVRCEYVLNELGGFTQHHGDKRVYPVQVAEKGVAWCTITARGEPGHGSIPRPDAALPRLAEAAHRLATTRLKHRVHPIVRRFVQELARGYGGRARWVLPGLTNATLEPWALKLLPDGKIAHAFAALLRNTANPTVFVAGAAVNVVPAKAALKVDGRLLPGQTPGDLLGEIRWVIGDGFDVTIDHSSPGVVCDPDDPLIALLKDVVGEHDPGAEVVVNMIPGFTDNPAYVGLGAKCYGFVPVKLDRHTDFASLYHGHNERISLAGFRWGLKVFLDAVLRLCT